MPPPSEYPTTPTSWDEPRSAVRPCSTAASTTSIQIVPEATRAGLRFGVDLDPGHARGVHEQCPVEGAPGAVAGSLDGDTQAELARVVDRGDDVVDGLGQRDRRRALVDGEVHAVSCLIPRRVSRGRRGSRVRRPCVWRRLMSCDMWLVSLGRLGVVLPGSRRARPGAVRFPRTAGKRQPHSCLSRGRASRGSAAKRAASRCAASPSRPARPG